MKSLNFRLSVDEEGWPPANAECVHAELVPQGYRVKNIPLFIKGLAYDDIISVQLDTEGYVSEWSLVRASGHSTIWIMNHRENLLVEQLEKLGCACTRLERWNLCTIDVPPSTDIADIDSLIDQYENEGVISAAYPAFRH